MEYYSWNVVFINREKKFDSRTLEICLEPKDYSFPMLCFVKESICLLFDAQNGIKMNFLSNYKKMKSAQSAYKKSLFLSGNKYCVFK